MCRLLRNTALAGLFFAATACGASIVVLGPLVREHQMEPGQEAGGTFEVRNPANKTQEVKIYQTDYFFAAGSGSVYGEPGQLPRSNARWVTYTPQRLVLPPGEGVKVNYTIRTPDDASLAGTYWSMLMVEPVPEDSPESSLAESSKPMIAIRQVVRYGIQVITHVGTMGRRELKFTRIRLQEEEGKRILAVDVENIGEQMLSGTFWTEFYDGGGRLVGKLDDEKKRLHPGTSVRFTVELAGFQDATYKALIVVDCGGDDVFGASANLVLGR